MSFYENNHQFTFDDPEYNMTPYQKKLFADCWQKQFGDEVFPRIDEKPFAVLYSDNEASRHNTPVNAQISVLLLKELTHQTSFEGLIEDIVFDGRLQYAIHYTPDPEKGPLCSRTLRRFRVACEAYRQETGIDLIGNCIKGLGKSFAKLMDIDCTLQRIDSTLIAANIRELSRYELIFECVQNLALAVNKTDPAFLPESLRWYLDKAAYNNTFYHKKTENYEERLLVDAAKMLELCKDQFSDTKDYELLARCVGEQTVVEDGKIRLATSEDGKMKGDIMQSPYDTDATCTYKYGAHKGYSGMVVESVGENGSVITDFDLQNNLYSDSKFAEDVLDRIENPEGKEITLLGDGAFCGDNTKEHAAAKNVNIITTNLTGALPDDFMADFELNEDGTAVVKCPHGKAPVQSTYDAKYKTIKNVFNPCDCQNCPHKDICKPDFLKTRPEAKKEVRPTTVHRAQAIRFKSTKEFRACARLRNGVETVFSTLKNEYGFERTPRGLWAMRQAFAFKIGAYNFRKLFRFRKGSGHYAQNPIFSHKNVEVAG